MILSPTLPIPDPIPAPAWVFHGLELVFFTFHILLINVLIGSACIAFVSQWRTPGKLPRLESVFPSKLPTIFAFAVNMGVAVLLFVQVIYGNLFYTSSILIGTYWILIIPAIIVAYYALYAYAGTARRAAATAAIGITAALLLSIPLVFVNNMIAMMHPELWGEYFSSRNGTLLRFWDSTFIPRYLHFIVASIALGGLFTAAVWTTRKKSGNDRRDEMVERGLSVFGYATVAQFVIGFWFLFSLKQEVMLQFMGKNIPATISLWLGFLCGVGAVASSLGRQFRPAIILIAVTVVAMVFVRDQLRSISLQGVYDPATVEVHSQNGMLLLFVAVVLAGIGVVSWLVRTGFPSGMGRAER